ncbi:DUF3802 family protein [Aliivibrio kagoshimensis]|jgi:hypothetical protein|uniref:DUF3802 family protein n=1 Tax=Aliivibrio kagoshimensis TaxID=2910230 RepID=UPI003D0E2B4D
MVVDNDGYLSLIEYLTENLALFIDGHGDTGDETVEDVVTDMVASNIMTVFDQNPELSSIIRFQLLKEADAVVDDLGEVLASAWGTKATNEQVAFLEEYISLIKNLFDSVLAQ